MCLKSHGKSTCKHDSGIKPRNTKSRRGETLGKKIHQRPSFECELQRRTKAVRMGLEWETRAEGRKNFMIIRASRTQDNDPAAVSSPVKLTM